MFFTKISISIVILISALTLLTGSHVISTNRSGKEVKATAGSYHSNIDSLISHIKTNGWKEEYISECRFYIINADKKSSNDLKRFLPLFPKILIKVL